MLSTKHVPRHKFHKFGNLRSDFLSSPSYLLGFSYAFWSFCRSFDSISRAHSLPPNQTTAHTHFGSTECHIAHNRSMHFSSFAPDFTVFNKIKCNIWVLNLWIVFGFNAINHWSATNQREIWCMTNWTALFGIYSEDPNGNAFDFRKGNSKFATIETWIRLKSIPHFELVSILRLIRKKSDSNFISILKSQNKSSMDGKKCLAKAKKKSLLGKQKARMEYLREIDCELKLIARNLFPKKVESHHLMNTMMKIVSSSVQVKFWPQAMNFVYFVRNFFFLLRLSSKLFPFFVCFSWNSR